MKNEVTFSVCRHPEILLSWQRDLTTSLLYLTPLYNINCKFSSSCTDASSPQKKLGERASLNGLQVLLTLSTKSNYAWIHLKMPNSIFLFMTLIFPVDCEYSRLSSLLTPRDVSRAIFQSRRGETTVFAGYFLASVEALMSNLTFNWLCFLV